MSDTVAQLWLATGKLWRQENSAEFLPKPKPGSGPAQRGPTKGELNGSRAAARTKHSWRNVKRKIIPFIRRRRGGRENFFKVGRVCVYLGSSSTRILGFLSTSSTYLPRRILHTQQHTFHALRNHSRLVSRNYLFLVRRPRWQLVCVPPAPAVATAPSLTPPLPALPHLPQRWTASSA